MPPLMTTNQGKNVPQPSDHTAKSLNCPGDHIVTVCKHVIKGATTAFCLCCPIATVFIVESRGFMPYLSSNGLIAATNPVLRHISGI
jgi:hypothetical protein